MWSILHEESVLCTTVSNTFGNKNKYCDNGSDNFLVKLDILIVILFVACDIY
jgi:hypothetical protein